MEKSETKKKRKWPRVLLIIFLIIGTFAAYIVYRGSRNMDAMDKALDSGMEMLSKYAAVKETDPGEYKQIKMYGVMKFDVSQYDVEEIGNLSVMKTNMGFMQMVSFVITPYEKNMPMLSMDFMYILGKRKAYVEYYDLVADKKTPEYREVIDTLRKFEGRYINAEDIETKPAWYDKYLTIALHKAYSHDDDEDVQRLFSEAVRYYMEAAENVEKLSPEERERKLAITQKYCDDLVRQGGVSTDVFKKSLGEKKTKDFFNKVMFGSELYS